MSRYQRPPSDEGASRVTPLELFYDLVFVFAITQVSHLLLSRLTWEGAGQSLLVLLVVWWAWNYTTWVTNELDPERVAVRLLLIGLMLASLVMAVAIPDAFGDRSLLFAGAYVAIQCGRHTFLAYGASAPGTLERERAERILLWFAVAGVFWIAGGIADGGARTALWLIALAIDYGAPAVTYTVPGMKPMPATSWTVETSHFAERFGLFILLALGETIVVTGLTTSGSSLDLAEIVAFSVAFLSTAAMWWLYFTYVARIAERRLELAGDRRTNMARDAYTFLHIALVAGIIVAAVGDELVIAHPTEKLPVEELAAIAGGPALYLVAHSLFRRRMAGTWSKRRLVGAAACVAAGLCGAFLPGLAVAALVLAALVGVIVSEELAAHRRAARGEPSPLENLEQAPAVG